jgi:DNA-dependent RNA polymerase
MQDNFNYVKLLKSTFGRNYVLMQKELESGHLFYTNMFTAIYGNPAITQKSAQDTHSLKELYSILETFEQALEIPFEYTLRLLTTVKKRKSKNDAFSDEYSILPLELIDYIRELIETHEGRKKMTLLFFMSLMKAIFTEMFNSAKNKNPHELSFITLAKSTGKALLRKVIDNFVREKHNEDSKIKTFTNNASESLLVHLGKFILTFLIEKNLFILIDLHRNIQKIDISPFMTNPKFELFTTQYLLADLPMICEPRPWKKLEDGKTWTGGYLTYDINLVIDKGDFHKVQIENVDYINYLQSQPYSLDYTFQSTINEARNADKLAKEEADKKIPKMNPGKFQQFNILLEISNLIRQLEIFELYFIHVYDFRTRKYTSVTTLFSIQSMDIARSLLIRRFSYRLKTQESVEEFLSYGTIFLIEKLTSQEARINWVFENKAELYKKLRSGNIRSFQGLVKDKEIFTFFNWLTKLEEVGFFERKLERKDIAELKGVSSNFMQKIDATASGLQNISLFMLCTDEFALKHLNISNTSDMPLDIYQAVLTLFKENLSSFFYKGKICLYYDKENEENNIYEDQKIMTDLIEVVLTRYMSKSIIMTIFYGVSKFKLYSNMIEEKLAVCNQFYKNLNQSLSEYRLSLRLKKIIDIYYSFIKEKALPSQAQFLKAIRAIVNYRKFKLWATPYISWKLLDGEIFQHYVTRETKRIKITLKDKNYITLTLKKSVNKVDLNKAHSATPANIIHSFDAQITRLVFSNLCKLEKSHILLGDIHDCFLIKFGYKRLLVETYNKSLCQFYCPLETEKKR